MITAHKICYFLLAALTLLLLFIWQPPHLIVDEFAHIKQIDEILSGRFEQLPNITTFIYFHGLYASLIELFNFSEKPDYRIISTGVSFLLAINIYWLSVTRHQCESIYSSTQLVIALQLLMLPIALPYYTLVYTDIMALMFLLMGMTCLLREKHWPAAALAGLAVLIRQPNLVWLAFMASMVFFSGFKLGLKHVKAALIKSLPYIMVSFGFIVFFIYNQGIALGDKSQHPISFNPTNVYFMALLACILFLPVLLSRAKHVWLLLRNKPWIWLLLALGLPSYYLTFEVTHIYNNEAANIFIRNWLINTINNHAQIKIASYFMAAYALLAVATIELKKPAWNWLYPFLPLSVIAMPLSEQRYYMVGFALWQIARIPNKRSIELVQLVWFIIVSGFLYLGLSKAWFLI